MKIAPYYLFLLIATVMTACASHSKKIIIMASSDIQVDPATQKTVTVTEGTTHHEKELIFTGGDPVTLNIQTPAGKYTLEAAEDGIYIANLKPDTVVGSYQHVGENADAKIDQDQLKLKIDSLQKLIAGQNVTAANRNYFIVPGKMVKISPEVNAKIFGPFTTIPGGFDAGSVPEIYKFYSNKEVRAIIGSLTEMTKLKPGGQ
ncbi:MAG: hypothetical protein P4L51_22185 [Puia sp.]|nr:hypothetical protein [Puia sp.]